MPKRRSVRVKSRRRTKKSWWSFLFVIAIVLLVGIPIVSRVTNPHGQVAGTNTAFPTPAPSTSPIPTPPPNNVSVASIYSKGCAVGYFQYVQYTCTNGVSRSYTSASCVTANNLINKAYNGCGVKITPTPTASTLKCTINSQCPSGYFCSNSTGACTKILVTPTNAPTKAPSPTISPAKF